MSTTTGLLDIKLSTSPDPPQASPETGTQRTLSLTFVVSLPEGEDQLPVLCDKLTFDFDLPGQDERDGATYLTTTGAQAMADRPAEWELETTLPANTFVFKRPDGVDPKIVDKGFTFEIYDIVVSPVVGTALVHVTEHSALDDGTHSQVRERVFEVPKFPPKFASVEFDSDVTTVEPNGRAKLTWKGDSNADYQLTVADGNPTPVPSTGAQQTDPLTEDTEFRLTVKHQSDGVEVKRSYYLTVHVRLPHAQLMYDPPAILRGGSSVLTWNVQSVHDCVVEGAPPPASIDGLDELKVTPEHTTKYKLRCKTKSGATFPSNEVTVEVLQKAPAMVADLFFIRTADYDGLVELHTLQGASHLQRAWAIAPTDFAAADGQDGVWMVTHFPSAAGQNAPPNLMFVRTGDTSPGALEVKHLARTPSNHLVTSGTYHFTFQRASAALGTWRLMQGPWGNPDGALVFIQTKDTASGKVEVSHSGFNSAGVQGHYVSMYPAGDHPKGTWLWVKMTPTSKFPDLVFIQTSDTDSGYVELSYATAASIYSKRGGHWETDFDTADAGDGTWQLVDVDDDGQLELVFVKTKNTKSGRIEVYVARPGDNYKDPSGGYTAFDAAEGPNGHWQVALWWHADV
jgi:hypothetical protein